VACVATLWTKLPGEEMTAAGMRRSTSIYVKMRDGTEEDRERADRIEADAGSGRGGAAVSSGPVERRLCLPVSGWGELAGAAAGGPQAGTDAGGLRNSAGWQPSLAGFFAQPGRKPSRLGGAARGSVPAWSGGTIARPDSHRRLRRLGGGDSDRLSASAASTLLGGTRCATFSRRRANAITTR
jgi:hypothetical protein